MCRVLKMPKSTYYQSFHKQPNSYHVANEQLLERIRVIHQDSKGLYGAPKIFIILQSEGYTGTINRIQRIMKKEGIQSTITKKYRPTPTQKPVEERENVLEQDFTTTKINEKWVADITYIHTLRHGWCYLASVLDLHTKKVIGHKFSRKMTTEIVLEALDNAVQGQQPGPGLIVHTDLGTQYTSEAFQERLKKYEMIPSFSRKGCPYDNAVAEATFKVFKTEFANQAHFTSLEQLALELGDYVHWFNNLRLHGTLGYLTPMEYKLQPL